MDLNKYETAIFANGCFWCSEAIFQKIIGVKEVKPGYIGGKTENPTYEDVCTGLTDHAEAIEIIFDNKTVTGVKTHTGAIFEVRAVVVATGTFLGGKIIMGDYSRKSGPDGMFPADALSENLKENGIEVILDVVFNHTAEGNKNGPFISFKGFDNNIYYMLTPDGDY